VGIPEPADLEALHALRADERKRPPAVAGARLALTCRERQVLQLVAEGFTSAQIGNRLTLGVRTVETHRAKVMRKLRVHTAAAMVRVALQNGLLRD